MNKIKLLNSFVFLAFLFLIFIQPIWAQDKKVESLDEEILEGRIVEVLEEGVITRDGQDYLQQKLKILITKGSLEKEFIVVDVGDVPLVGQPRYKKGDMVLIEASSDFQGNKVFYISDYLRRKPLIALFFIFVMMTFLVGGWQGLSSLVGLFVSFLVIFKFILPNIYAGHNPILIAIAGALIIVLATFYLSHGFNKKTTIAVIATFISLSITGFLAIFFVDFAKLTGYASEEAAFLQATTQQAFNIRGLLLAGIIIGTLGVLDDVTVSQAAIVQQLKEANPKISAKKLFLRAMRVGRDHIASMVNTLILVYAGGALPLLLLFLDSSHSFSQVVNYEIISEEIIRALVGSIGLISAVPITTLLASQFNKTIIKGKG